jgi:hypothetical protein
VEALGEGQVLMVVQMGCQARCSLGLMDLQAQMVRVQAGGGTMAEALHLITMGGLVGGGGGLVARAWVPDKLDSAAAR